MPEVGARPSIVMVPAGDGETYIIPVEVCETRYPILVDQSTFNTAQPAGIGRFRGGYGDPSERDPSLVESDVRNEYLSREEAREIYGVIVEPDSLVR